MLIACNLHKFLMEQEETEIAELFSLLRAQIWF